MSTEMVNSFISDSMSLAEEFHDFSAELLGGHISSETIGAIFRSVHSMKGGSGFLIAEDAQLAPLNGFCHELETFLALIRDGELHAGPASHELVAKCLDSIANDLDLLSSGQKPSDHADLIERFARLSLVSTERRNGFLIFQILRDIQMGSDADCFTKILAQDIEREGEDAVIVIDFEGKHKLSSLPLGAILGFINKVSKIVFLRPPVFMEKLFKRFNLEDQGVEIRHGLEGIGDESSSDGPKPPRHGG